MVPFLFYFGSYISKLPFPSSFSNFHRAAFTRFVSSRLKSKYLKTTFLNTLKPNQFYDAMSYFIVKNLSMKTMGRLDKVN